MALRSGGEAGEKSFLPGPPKIRVRVSAGNRHSKPVPLGREALISGGGRSHSSKRNRALSPWRGRCFSVVHLWFDPGLRGGSFGPKKGMKILHCAASDARWLATKFGFYSIVEKGGRGAASTRSGKSTPCGRLAERNRRIAGRRLPLSFSCYGGGRSSDHGLFRRSSRLRQLQVEDRCRRIRRKNWMPITRSGPNWRECSARTALPPSSPELLPPFLPIFFLQELAHRRTCVRNLCGRRSPHAGAP